MDEPKRQALFAPQAICGEHAQPWPGHPEVVHCTRPPGHEGEHLAVYSRVPLVWS